MRFDRRITAVDIHADGMPGRVITGGVPDVPGSTMLEKARYLEAHGDDLRKLMLNEPRGYPASCCNLILPSSNPAADHGYVIMEHVEYPAMSGSNTICVATVLIETGMVELTEPITRFTLEAPAGLIDITATVKDGKATSITFRNVPAFVAHLGVPVEIPLRGDRDDRHRMGRDVLRHHRCLGLRTRADPRRGQRHRALRQHADAGR